MNKILSILVLIFINTINAQVIDVITNFPAPGYLVKADNFLYITQDDTGSIYKIDLTDPNPVAQWVTGNANFITNPVVFENRLFYAVNNGQDIYEIDINEAQPTPQLFLSGVTTARGLLLNGTTLYISEGDPSNKIVKTSIIAPNPNIEDVVAVTFPGQLWLEDDQLYISAQYGEEILKIDINDSNPVPQLIIQTNGNIRDLLVYDDELWFSYPALDKISKLDSNNNIIQMIGAADYAGSILVIDNYLYFCFDQQISKVNITDLPIILGINDLSRAKLPMIYPNPTCNTILLDNLIEPLVGRIINPHGQIVKQAVFENGKNVSVAELTNGLYFIKLEGAHTLKFIKK